MRRPTSTVSLNVPIPITCERCNFLILVSGDWYQCVVSNKVLNQEETWSRHEKRASWCELDKENPVVHIR